jgi:hypothetical protein
MHKARAFFFVCAGLFLLALAYHLGATSAKAQVGTRMVGIDIMGSWPGRIAIDESGQLYEEHNIGSGRWTATFQLAGRPVALTTRNDDGNLVWVLMDNGDLYEANGSVTGGWPPQFVYNICNISDPTPAQSISIGQLKAKYAR